MINYQQSQALTSNFESFWSIVRGLKINKDKMIWDFRTTTTTKTTTQARLTGEGTYLPQRRYHECGYSVATGYVYGGDLALKGEFPYTALLGE